MTKSPIPFQGFDERGEIRIYSHGLLPHWRQCGCTYFVTFRLDDSIPAFVLKELEQERIAWLKAHSIDPADDSWKHRLGQLPVNERREYERFVGQWINKSLDECHGDCVLRNPAVGQQVATALEFFHGTRVLTGDFVVMPNHVHALMTPMKGFELEEILHSIKSYTANQINRLLGRTGTLWQKESYDHVVRDGEQLRSFQRYIALNPEKANLKPGEFILSQAKYLLL